MEENENTSLNLADFEEEGEDLSGLNKVGTPTESPTVNEPSGDEPSQGDPAPVAGANTEPENNVPFHKHPRWIQRENDFKALQEKLAAFESRKSPVPQNESAIPEWFTELYGANDVAWQKYQKYETERQEQIKQDFFKAQEEAQREAEEEEKKWTQWVDDGIETLVTTKQFNPEHKNDLIQIMLDYRPIDEQGNLDFEKGYKIYQLQQQQKKEEIDAKREVKKRIADTTSRKTAGESPKKDYVTAKDIRNKSWQSIS